MNSQWNTFISLFLKAIYILLYPNPIIFLPNIGWMAFENFAEIKRNPLQLAMVAIVNEILLVCSVGCRHFWTDSSALLLPVCARIFDYPNFLICKWQLLNHPFDYIWDNFGLWIRYSVVAAGQIYGEKKSIRSVAMALCVCAWNWICAVRTD